MANIRLSRALCAVVGEVFAKSDAGHATLDRLFMAAGAPGPPPDVAHATKWKEWLFRAGEDPTVDGLRVLGNVLEEFMDVAPSPGSELHKEWVKKRGGVVEALEENGFRYFRGGRIVPTALGTDAGSQLAPTTPTDTVTKPSGIEEVLQVLATGLRRAMDPLTHRRKGLPAISFGTEYDIQDLLHALMRPWVKDIRPEEHTPSYAGTATRMDFLLPAYNLVIEVELVRDRAHAKRVGDELIIDIEHYKRHPACKNLWCLVYDPETLLPNPGGLVSDLQGTRAKDNGSLSVRVLIL